MFGYPRSPTNPPRTPIYLYTPTPRYQYTTIPLYLGTNIVILLRARGLLVPLVGVPPSDWVPQNRPFWHQGTRIPIYHKNILFTTLWPCFTIPQGTKISTFQYPNSPLNPRKTSMHLYTSTPRNQYTTIPLYLGTNIGILLRARGLLVSLVGFPWMA